MVVFQNFRTSCVTLLSSRPISQNKIIFSILVIFNTVTAVLDTQNNQICREIFCQNKHQFDQNLYYPQAETETLLRETKTKEPPQFWVYRNHTRHSSGSRSVEIYQYENQLSSKNLTKPSSTKYDHSQIVNGKKSRLLVFPGSTKYYGKAKHIQHGYAPAMRSTRENENSNPTFGASFLRHSVNIPGRNISRNGVTKRVNVSGRIESINSEDNVSKFTKTVNIPSVNILKNKVPVMKNLVNIDDNNISEKNVSLFRNKPHTWESGESLHFLGNDTEAS